MFSHRKYSLINIYSSTQNRDIFNNGTSVYVSWALRKEDRRRNYEG